MSKSIYLISPRPDHPWYYTSEVFDAWDFAPGVLVADLALPTVAALVPDDFRVRLCDEKIEPVDFGIDADFVGITGQGAQEMRMLAIAREFRRRGKTVLIGGPFASLSPERMRPECDILVRGEIENIAGALFADLRNSTWKREYIGDRPDLRDVPLPRWDLYPNHRAVSGAVQTSRGCPFECEFCDVIQYLGRKQRHKPPAQVIRELDQLYRLGYRSVFLADDNLTVYRARAKELLLAIREWNDSLTEGRSGFITQLSIECARDPELLQLLAEAGVFGVFIGIETPNQASLKESKKRQNMGIDLVERVERFLAHGIKVDAGMIVGFDADTRDIFEQQYEFSMSAPIPILSINPLIAPETTPLYDRMASEGRLVEVGEQFPLGPHFTNIIPRQMSRGELLSGVKWLCNRLYRPEAFGQRMLRFIDSFRPHMHRGPAGARASTKSESRAIDLECVQIAGRVLRLGAQEEAMIARIGRHIRSNPAATSTVMWMLWQYMQIRCMYQKTGLWDADLGREARPVLDRGCPAA
jgi:hypothetical protein